MPDNQRVCSPKFPQNQCWSIDSFTTNDSESKKVIRKFINSAIYVEKPINEMPPLRKKSPIFINSCSDGEYICRTDNIETQRSQKQNSFRIPPKIIYCKSSSIENLNRNIEFTSESPNTNSSSDTESQITVKSIKQIESQRSEMKLSLISLPTERTGNNYNKEKEEIIKNWLKKKELERKKKEKEETKVKEAKEKERQLLLEKERENFKRWLAEKKQEEEKKQKQKEIEEEERKLKEADKEKRKEENETSFNKWLKNKKRVDLEKKIKEKLALLQIYEAKQKRMEENEKAYKEWLKNSKHKALPLPLNQGLQSLCSSTSVTYINPVPWIPNIEFSQKPVSQ